MKRILLPLFFIGVLSNGAVRAEVPRKSLHSTDTSAFQYLSREVARMAKEGDRIEGQAGALRSESRELTREKEALLDHAAGLDRRWARANQIDPDRYPDYPGRDRSQKIMRADASTMIADGVGLLAEGRRLDAEATRLRQLAMAVEDDAIGLMKRRQRSAGAVGPAVPVAGLRTRIIQLALAYNVQWSPM
jgi:hypothetical protein